MKNRDDSMSWIPLWIDKWIFGSTRIELQPDERSVWIDLMAIASKDNGFIRANPKTPYPPQQLAGLLYISEELLHRTIQKCISTGKIKECGNPVENNFTGYYILNWSTYQLTDRYKRRFQANVQEKGHSSPKTEHMTPKTEPIGEDRREEERREEESLRGETKNPFSSLSNQIQSPSKTLDPISRKAELKRQAYELLTKEEPK